ncbi:MAG: TlyA family RNA methyltransferase [Hyphomicrobiaceae bacterium]
MKERLDQALVSRGLVVSRARARDLILRGQVVVDGAVAHKPSQKVGPQARLGLPPGAGDYVSRGALKLRGALAHFEVPVAGRIGLDVGASTGGFTEALLEAGAVKVYAIDNGRGQLHPRLAGDPRVVSIEDFDARDLGRAEIAEPVGIIVSDVSFISLEKALPAALALAAPGAWLVALIKPQFEAEPGRVPRNGVIVDAAVHAQACEKVRAWLAALPGWQVRGIVESAIKGGDGNTEFLIGAVHDG